MAQKNETRGGVQGKTLTFRFTEGPTKGKSYVHKFGEDGTVTYGEPGQSGGESAKYASFPVCDHVELISYMSKAGFTLSLALDFAKREIVGFASGGDQWFPVRGVIED